MLVIRYGDVAKLCYYRLLYNMETNKNYYIELEVVTPLCVGGGNDREWMMGSDYVVHEGKAYVVDLHRVAECGIDLVKLSDCLVRQDIKSIVNLLKDHLPEVSVYTFDMPSETEENIKSFLRSQLHDAPLVAGSSLKGAIRSVLFAHLRDGERDNAAVFGSLRDNTDYMRYIQVGDIELPKTSLYNTKLFNLRGFGKDADWNGGWKHGRNNTTDKFLASGFNTIYECAVPSAKGYGIINFKDYGFRMLLDNTRKEVAHRQEKMKIVGSDIQYLFRIINDHTRAYLLKEKDFFSYYDADRTSEIVRNINVLLDSIPADNSFCLLKMSAGSGFHSITGDWQYADYTKTGFNVGTTRQGNKIIKKKYKSRRIVQCDDTLTLMGFVRLTCVGRDVYQQGVRQVCDRISAVKTERANAILERKRQKAEELRRQQALEQRYDIVMAEADELAKSGDYIAALKKADEAGTLMSYRREHTVFIDSHSVDADIQRHEEDNKKLEMLQKQREEADAQRNSVPLSARLAEINNPSIGNIAGTTGKWIVSGGHVFTETELCTLCDVIESVVSADEKKKKSVMKELRAKRKAFVKAIGPEWTDKLYSHFN